jgi:nitronate monooxygenase
MATPAEAQPSSSSLSLGAGERAARFCRRFGLQVPILQAPMAGACPTSLASAVANAGVMGGLGALTTPPDGIANWVREFRDQSNGGFQINLWTPDPPPVRDVEREREV